MTRAQIRAHRWDLTAALAAALAVTGWLSRSALVPFPLVADPVPARILVGVGVSLVALLPLYGAFPALETTLVREQRLRVARVAATILVAAAAVSPAWSATDDPRWNGNLALLELTMAAGVLAVTVVGELAWAVPFSIGILAVVLDNGGEQRVTRVLDAVPAWLTGLLLLVAGAVYARRGPAQQR